MSLTVGTIGDLIDGGYCLTAYCTNFDRQRNAELDLEALAARLGRDHGSMHWDLAPKLRCSKCGCKAIEIRISPPTGSPGQPYVPKKTAKTSV